MGKLAFWLITALLTALFTYFVWPVLCFKLVIWSYPKNDPRREELQAEVRKVPIQERIGFIRGMCTLLFTEALPARRHQLSARITHFKVPLAVYCIFGSLAFVSAMSAVAWGTGWAATTLKLWIVAPAYFAGAIALSGTVVVLLTHARFGVHNFRRHLCLRFLRARDPRACVVLALTWITGFVCAYSPAAGAYVPFTPPLRWTAAIAWSAGMWVICAPILLPYARFRRLRRVCSRPILPAIA
jgi:hypothetical protein